MDFLIKTNLYAYIELFLSIEKLIISFSKTAYSNGDINDDNFDFC